MVTSILWAECQGFKLEIINIISLEPDSLVHGGLNFGGVSGRVHGLVQSMVNPQNAWAII